MSHVINRINEEGYNVYNSKMIIIKYNNANDIDIYFPKYDYVVKNRRYLCFKRGSIDCCFDKTVYGIGYLGEGDHKSSIGNKKTNCYQSWQFMLERCYDKKWQIKNPTYKGCTVCEEWHCFQNFAEWYNDNYYEIKGEIMSLDKDIIVKGNKIYSPETCMFVPQRINSLFVKNDKNRGKYPIGVSWHKYNKKYRSTLHKIDKKYNHLGYFDNIEDAFLCYKYYKEKYIKEVANEYKNKIPQKLHDAMCKWTVDRLD